MDKRIKIVVDAMGGDFAPRAIVEGSVCACREYGVDICLVGNKDLLNKLLENMNATHLPISVYHASEIVEMHDNPLDVVRKKKDSSINVGMQLLNENKAEAFVSAGNSGAVVAAGLFILKRIAGIDRPAIATILPTLTGQVTVLDAGANNSCKPFNLVQFAVMGSVYSKYFSKCPNPRIGVLSNGEEDTKGTEIVKNTHKLLMQSSLNYIGFVEGKDVFNGNVDVAVCDGFTGNILLKVAEGVASTMGAAIKDELGQTTMTKIGFLFAKKAFTNLKKRFDYSEMGGAPLLGVNSPVIIAHGRSCPKALKNAIRAARDFTQNNVINHIQNDLEINNDLQTVGKKPSFINRVLQDINLK